ncbi:hypothetical protein OGAPHI_004242 [Ogataea philodendri]|uniref:Potassium transport protein n=1 Tax=Ogataea philodendri TaxID=1378263 RepID=A0A9P8P577_9ASCO|nr:uncharacterized protein OGAPHI_004242 [Ogataea philodendri]KAH3666053.1 hypothetical protein OGAPHI_004242 [Ogataea philodendri]
MRTQIPRSLPKRSISFQYEFRRSKQFWFKVRKGIYYVQEKLGPIVRRLIPNFLVAHYTYIIFWCIIGSILIYPQRNIKYIDALFFACGASTQAGLNTVDTNKLTLFQQMAIYIVSMLTTPIFIHSAIVFLRLFWFEKSFDDIKEKSMQNFKMRRSATLAQFRTQTMDSRTLTTNRTNTTVAHTKGYNTHNASEDLGERLNKLNQKQQEEDHEQKLDKVFENEYFVPTSSSSGGSPEMKNHEKGHDIEMVDLDGSRSRNEQAVPVIHYSEPSDDEEEEEAEEEEGEEEEEIPQEYVPHTRDIKFAELPKPPKKRREKDVEPRDLYMSISMMQQNKNNDTADDESGPALVIQGPAERTGFKLPGHISRHEKELKRKQIKKLKKMEKMQTEQPKANPADPPRGRAIQFEDPVRPPRSSANRPRHESASPLVPEPEAEAEASEDENLSADEGDLHSVGDLSDDQHLSDEEDGSGFRHIGRTQSHVVKLPTEQHGTKIDRRAHTFDVSTKKNPENHKKVTNIVKSPTFDKMLRKNMKKKANRFTRIGRRFTASRSLPFTSSVDSAEDLSDDGLISLYSRSSRNTQPKYLSWTPTIGRNSTFVALTDQQKEELGGVEYRALKLLSAILVFYYVGFHLMGIVFFVPFITTKLRYLNLVREDGVAPVWWGFWYPQTCFNDLGITLTPDSMNSFSENAYSLIIGGCLIIAGNTGFPIMLRFIIWILYKFSRPLTLFRESLAFLMEHPRRCFTLLFPSGPTWWLFFVLVVLNSIDWLLFIILDFNKPVLSGVDRGYRVLDGLFQAISTRTAGLSVVDLSQLSPAVQVSYLVMMYISVMPLAISIRRTNVYEEQSLGVYFDNDANNNENDDKKQQTISFIGTHLRKQLSFDLWFLFLGLFIICISEGGKLTNGDVHFTIFSVLFEITSAYGTVGLSLGYPNTTPSFCGQFNTLSKVVLIVMMVRGRHRGLPYAIDRAIILETDKIKMRDDMQAHHTLRRTQTLQPHLTSVSSQNAPLLRVNTTRNEELDTSNIIPFLRRKASAAAGELKRSLLHHGNDNIDEEALDFDDDESVPSYPRYRDPQFEGTDVISGNVPEGESVSPQEQASVSSRDKLKRHNSF